MDVAREQCGADLPFKIVDAPANDVDRQLKPFRRGSETSAANHLKENPGRIPIRKAAERGVLVFLLRNAPFRHQMHTLPLPPTKLCQNIERTTTMAGLRGAAF